MAAMDATTMTMWTASESTNPESQSINLYVYILIGVLAVVMNIIVLFVIRRQNELQDYMRVLYQVLASSDLILAVSWSMWDYFWFSPSNRKSCTIITLVFPYTFYVSIWFIMMCLCGISFNLFLLVTKPLRYHTIVTRKRFFITLTSVLVLIMVACGIYLPIPESPFVKLLTQRCLAQDPSAESEWTSLVHTCYLVVPICATMAFTTTIYIRLLVIACRKATAVDNVQIPHNLNQTGAESFKDDGVDVQGRPSIIPQMVFERDRDRQEVRPRRRFRRFKGFGTILLLTGSFSMVWIPTVINFIFPTGSRTVAALDMMSISNTWVQPVVYLITNSEARNLCLRYAAALLEKVHWVICMGNFPNVIRVH